MRLLKILLCFISINLFWLIFANANHSLNNKLYDNFFELRYKLTGKEIVFPFIGHIDLNDANINKLGISKWEREVFAELITNLKSIYVDTTIVDIFFQKSIESQSNEELEEAILLSENVYLPIIPKLSQYADTTIETALDNAVLDKWVYSSDLFRVKKIFWIKIL